jgi:hypothetical protein
VQSRPGDAVARLLQGTVDHGPCHIHPALPETKQRESGLRVAGNGACPPVRGFGLRELTAQPMQLALLVVRSTDRWPFDRLAEPGACLAGLVERVGPGAAQLQHLAAMDQTLTTEWDQLGLGVTPGAERRRPAAHPIDVEQFGARLDHSAVRISDDDRRDFACGDRHHRLV